MTIEKTPHEFPTIDPRVKHVGVSRLRSMTAAKLVKLEGIYVLRKNDYPLAVLVPYDTYLKMQKVLDETNG